MDQRRRLTIALGLIWLLDSGLQLQPFMFTAAFPDQLLRPAGLGSPAWVGGPNSWAASLVAGHLALWNTLFALVQLTIGVGLLLRRTTRAALALSMAWAVSVWWLGEALGGILAGPVSPLMGFPGAVILYAVIAVLVWPRAVGTGSGRNSVAAAGSLGKAGSAAVWILLWSAFAFEALRPANRSPSALHDMMQEMAAGQPCWLTSIDRLAISAAAHHGVEISFAAAALFAVIAVGIGFRRLVRASLVLAIGSALVMWVFVQNLGDLATGTATDPNSGPLLVLLACCYWPARSRA